jgi:hypothetical protein
MNYMNVLSDFEIRLNQWFPDTVEQEQIYKLGSQLIEKDMIIENQAAEIAKLSKKVARIKPASTKVSRILTKSPPKKKPEPEATTPVRGKPKSSLEEPGKKLPGRPRKK